MQKANLKVPEEVKTKISKNKSVQEWLDEARSQNTRRTYESRIATFFGSVGLSVEDYLKLDAREKRHLALKFQNERMNENPNSINGVLTALNSYLEFVDMKIDFKRKRVKPIPDLTSHNFSNGDLSKMFDASSTKEKALLSLACSLGWEIGAVLDLDRNFLSSLVARAKSENQQFIFFESQRKKTGARRLGVLNPLALEWVDKWLLESKDNKPRRRKINKITGDQPVSDVFDITASGVNKILRVLAKKAKLVKTGPRVHFHKLRGWVMSGLSRAGFNEFQIKYLIGKSIPMTDSTYLQSLREEIEERYPEAYERYLNLKPLVPIKTVTDLRKQIESQEKELESLRKSNGEIEALKRRMEFLDKYINLNDVVETESDAQRVLDFLHRMRQEKLEKEGYFKKADEQTEKLKKPSK